MEKVRLGMTELEVTPICFGTWQLGGEWGEYAEHEAIAAIRAAHELGVNFFDTAQAYGFGRSEEVLGRALAGELATNRDSLVIASKGGLRAEGDEMLRDSSPGWLRDGVEASLAALGIDHLDLYQVHWPDPETHFAETAEVLRALVDEGKIRHVGVSNFDAAEMREFAATLPVETLQPPYHLFNREVEDEVLPYCAEHDIGVLAYGPLAHGLLTGALDERTEFAADDWRSGSPMFGGEAYRRSLERVSELERLASERDLEVGQLAIAWVLANPAVGVAIVGTRSSDHIAAAVDAASVELSVDERERIERIMSGAVAAQGPSPEM
ncbi:MAG: aldo/keto reductase [Solirubrobacterales bacterium]|nr:aldo/keto reductase [Solirubrobacterales bacterium]